MADTSLQTLLSTKAALDLGLISQADFEAVKSAFLRAQQIKAALDVGLIKQDDYEETKQSFLGSLLGGGGVAVAAAPAPAAARPPARQGAAAATPADIPAALIPGGVPMAALLWGSTKGVAAARCRRPAAPAAALVPIALRCCCLSWGGARPPAAGCKGHNAQLKRAAGCLADDDGWPLGWEGGAAAGAACGVAPNRPHLLRSSLSDSRRAPL